MQVLRCMLMPRPRRDGHGIQQLQEGYHEGAHTCRATSSDTAPVAAAAAVGAGKAGVHCSARRSSATPVPLSPGGARRLNTGQQIRAGGCQQGVCLVRKRSSLVPWVGRLLTFD